MLFAFTLDRRAVKTLRIAGVFAAILSLQGTGLAQAPWNSDTKPTPSESGKNSDSVISPWRRSEGSQRPHNPILARPAVDAAELYNQFMQNYSNRISIPGYRRINDQVIDQLRPATFSSNGKYQLPTGGILYLNPDPTSAGSDNAILPPGTQIEALGDVTPRSHVFMALWRVRILSGELKGKEGWLDQVYIRNIASTPEKSPELTLAEERNPSQFSEWWNSTKIIVRLKLSVAPNSAVRRVPFCVVERLENKRGHRAFDGSLISRPVYWGLWGTQEPPAECGFTQKHLNRCPSKQLSHIDPILLGLKTLTREKDGSVFQKVIKRSIVSRDEVVKDPSYAWLTSKIIKKVLMITRVYVRKNGHDTLVGEREVSLGACNILVSGKTDCPVPAKPSSVDLCQDDRITSGLSYFDEDRLTLSDAHGTAPVSTNANGELDLSILIQWMKNESIDYEILQQYEWYVPGNNPKVPFR